MRKEKVIQVTHNPKNEFYTKNDIKYLLSFNCDYTVVSSIRNLGKSYGAMELALEKINSGKTVLWERYNRDEFKLACKTWENFHTFNKPKSCGGYIEYVDDMTGGKLLMCQTSIANNIKGYDDDNDKLPVLEIKDEFLPVRYTNSTRFQNEYYESMEIRKTFKRNGPMRSIYLSNCLNWINPYTVAWGITPIDTGTAKLLIDSYSVTVDDDEIVTDSRSIIWESVKPTKAQIKRIMRTEISSMNVNSLDDYIDNEFYKEYSKIGKCPDLTVQLEPLQIMSNGYYLGFRIHNGRYYFQKVNPDKNKDTYVGERNYIDIDTRHFRYPAIASDFETAFNNGVCVFDNAKSLYTFQNWLVNLRKRT